MNIIGKEIIFPDVEDADESGFLAVGGDLNPERLIEAYRKGIFPWYNSDEPICWWSPDPRCVLFPSHLYVSRSMQKVIRDGVFTFTLNSDFEKVMRSCMTTARRDSDGTWIQEEMVKAYTSLHKLGYALSAEAWKDGVLTGGLYGVKLGNVFFGESMFSTVSNASKFAFIKCVQQLSAEGVQLIDCQQRTSHLLSLGAEMISRKAFIKLLDKYC